LSWLLAVCAFFLNFQIFIFSSCRSFADRLLSACRPLADVLLLPFWSSSDAFLTFHKEMQKELDLNEQKKILFSMVTLHSS
jgi:hypothetical protein